MQHGEDEVVSSSTKILVTVPLTPEQESAYLQRAANMCMGEDDFNLEKTVELCLRSDLGYDNITYYPELIHESTTDFIDEVPEYDEIDDMVEPAITYISNQDNVSTLEIVTLCAAGPLVGFLTFKVVTFINIKYFGGIIPFFVRNKHSRK